MTENMQTAQTILQQLGGNRFRAMTGAKNFIALENGALSFRLPNNAANGINAVQVTLNGRDLYDVEFSRISQRKGVFKKEVKSTSEDIYFDQLEEEFTRQTKLYTRLF